jgi:serine protease SohB
MMLFLAEYGMFALKTITLVVAILLLVSGILSMGHKPRKKIKIRSLNQLRQETRIMMQKEVHGIKEKVKKNKQKLPTVFVLDFNGDIKASQVEQLRDEISAILSIIDKDDEIMIRIDSPGGAVNGYGLAASQLQRIRDLNIPLTACIDKIAASGGYLMACVAHQIIAAPFAIVGSIGVVAQLPNFHRLLKKNDIDIELLTAGEYKRTITMLGENTKAGREKFQEDLEAIHHQFKDYVLQNRSQVDIKQIATGEHWLGKDALSLKLVDKLQTSDSFLEDKMQTHRVFKVTIKGNSSLADKILKPALKLLHPWA